MAVQSSSVLDDDVFAFSPSFVASEAAVASSDAVEETPLPSGDIPDARTVQYHLVNPCFESEESPAVIFQTLLTACRKHNVDCKSREDWSVSGWLLMMAAS